MHDAFVDNKVKTSKIGVHIVPVLRGNCVKEMMQKVIKMTSINPVLEGLLPGNSQIRQKVGLYIHFAKDDDDEMLI